MTRAKNAPIFGIPCTLSDPEMREGVRKVLVQIRNRNPKDFERLHKRILGFRTRKDIGDGTLAEWVGPLGPDQCWVYEHENPGYVEITEGLSVERHVDVIAHELGHVATREEDLERRGPASDERRSELAADWYAYKWGFGKDIGKHRKTRDGLHHGPAPGHEYSEDRDGCYTTTRSRGASWCVS